MVVLESKAWLVSSMLCTVGANWKGGMGWRVGGLHVGLLQAAYK